MYFFFLREGTPRNVKGPGSNDTLKPGSVINRGELLHFSLFCFFLGGGEYVKKV